MRHLDMGAQYKTEHPGIIAFQGVPCPDGRPTLQCAVSDRLPTNRTQDTWIWAPGIGRNTLELSHSRVSHVLMLGPYPSVPCDTSGWHVASGNWNVGPWYSTGHPGMFRWLAHSPVCHVTPAAGMWQTGHWKVSPWYSMGHPGIIPFQGVPCSDGWPIAQCAV